MTSKVETFDKSELIIAAQSIYKVRPEVMVGALHNVKKPISIAEAKKLLEAFLTKPIGGK